MSSLEEEGLFLTPGLEEKINLEALRSTSTGTSNVKVPPFYDENITEVVAYESPKDESFVFEFETDDGGKLEPIRVSVGINVVSCGKEGWSVETCTDDHDTVKKIIGVCATHGAPQRVVMSLATIIVALKGNIDVTVRFDPFDCRLTIAADAGVAT